MCELDPAAPIMPPGFGFMVQRSWSNIAAAAGQNPCVPAATVPHPYVYVTPATPPDTLPFDIFMQKGSTLGYAIPVGQSRTIELAIISSGPTTGPINVTVAERPLHNAADILTLKTDLVSGTNGTRVMLTITANAASSTHFGFTPFAVEATYNGEGYDWFGLVQAK